jgi:hypothetical protein
MPACDLAAAVDVPDEKPIVRVVTGSRLQARTAGVQL